MFWLLDSYKWFVFNNVGFQQGNLQSILVASSILITKIGVDNTISVEFNINS